MAETKSHPKFKDIVVAAENFARSKGFNPKGEFKRVFENILADRIEEVARQSGTREQSVLTRYADAFPIEDVAQSVMDAINDRDHKLGTEPAIEITTAEAGRLLASLGRVSWVISFNQETINAKAPPQTLRPASMARLEAANIQAAASDAISGIGLAIAEASIDGPVDTITLSGPSLVPARTALRDTIRKIKRGDWDCGSPELNVAVPIGMEQDAFPILVREQPLGS